MSTQNIVVNSIDLSLFKGLRQRTSMISCKYLSVGTVRHQAFHHLGVSLRSRLHERGIPEP